MRFRLSRRVVAVSKAVGLDEPWRRYDTGDEAAAAAARAYGPGVPALVALGGAALWRTADVALRVERPANDADRLLRIVLLAEAAGVPVPSPQGSAVDNDQCDKKQSWMA